MRQGTLLNPQGDFRNKGLGTNPTGSAVWCAGGAYHSGMPSDTGMPQAKRKRAKSESKLTLYRRSWTAADVTDPSGLAKSLPHTASMVWGPETTPRGNRGYAIHSGIL